MSPLLLGALGIGGIALYAKMKKKEPPSPTAAAYNQLQAQLIKAFYNETNPDLLASLAVQAELQAENGPYTEAEKAGLRDSARKLKDRAELLRAQKAA